MLAVLLVSVVATIPAFGQQLSLATSVLDAPGDTVLTGDTFRYRASYSCNIATPPPPDCDGTSVEIDLPPEVEFLSSFFPPGDVASAVHDGSPTGGTVVFTFNPNVPAGNSGDLDVGVRFANGSTPNNTMTTVTVGEVRSMGVALTPQSTELPKVTALASPLVDVDVALLDGFLDSCQTGIGNEPSTYRVTIGPEDVSGSLDFDDVLSLVLVLPAGVDSVVPLDGGVEGPPGTITWANLGPLTVGSSVSVEVEVNFPAPTFSDGQVVTAMVSGTVDPIEEPPPVVDPTAFGPVSVMQTVERFEHTTGAAVSKSFGEGRPNSLAPGNGQLFEYHVQVSNTGTVPLDTLVVTDDGDGAGGNISTDLEINMVSTGVYSGLIGDPVTLTVTTDVGTHVVSGGGPTNGVVVVPGGEVVEMIEWDFTGGAPVGLSTVASAVITAEVLGAAAAVIDNHVTAAWTATPPPNPCGGADPPSSGTDGDQQLFSVNGDYTYLRPLKTETTTGPYFPTDTVSFSFDIENDALADDPAADVVVADLLPEFLDFTFGSEMFFDNGSGVSLAMFEEIDNYNGTGRTLLRWTLSGDLDPGESVSIEFDTTVLVGVVFGTLTNEMGVTFPVGSTQQECAVGSQGGTIDVRDLDGNGNSADTLCTASEAIEIAAIAQLRSEKLVRGQCDPTFLDAAAAPATTVPGGIVDWRVEVENIQTVPMEDFVIIDILPFAGDTGVVDLNPRLSLFRPLLIAPIVPPPGGTVFYSTSGNPCRSEVGGPSAGCDSGTFSVIPPVPITDTRSIKIEFTGLVLNPLDQLSYEWSMIAPFDAPVDGSEAFNSFAYGSRRQDDGGFLSAEPLKVGIDATCIPTAPDDAMLGDHVWVDSNGNGLQDEPASTRGVNDVPVELWQVGSDGLPRTGDDILVQSSITSDNLAGEPGYYKFSALSADDYYVCFQTPPNHEVTLQNVVGTEATDSDVDPQTACSDVVSLALSETNLDLDVGLVPTVEASLGNYVWFDRNGDGLQNEPLNDGVNGVVVKLFVDDGDSTPEPGTDDGTPLAITVTQNHSLGIPGYYEFTGLVPGTPYFVQFMEPPTATGFTSREAGSDPNIDSDASGSDGTSRVVVLAAGQHDPTIDAGLIPQSGTSSLGNVVWMDDGDDVFDPLSADMPLNGVRVELFFDLDLDGNPQIDEYFGATTTATLGGKEGRYRFDDLPDGDYIVVIPASNFASGGELEGKISVPLFSVDPNDDVDHDDSGITLGTVVISPPVTLTAGGETTIDADDDLEEDENINFALDFGFEVGTLPDFDFGDAPDAGAGNVQGDYTTTIFEDGAAHELSGPSGPYLGACVDSDSGFLQSLGADADDIAGALTVTHGACAAGADDEDGVSLVPSLLMVGGTLDVVVSSSSALPCLVSGWVDWNQDGVFDNFASEKILTDVAPGAFPGIPIPPTAVPGFTYARFRCSTAGGDGPTGLAADGEVEDYRVQLMGVDFGDAPDVPYDTLLASGGPLHDTDPNVEFYLGSCVDTEADGLPSTGADADDGVLGSSRVGDCIDDEDGVVFDTMLVRGNTATVTVHASMPGRLDAWVDFDRNLGNGFLGAGDQILTDVAVVPGPNVFMFAVPALADPGLSYARFRLSSTGGLAPIGPASDGEVEDYAVIIKAFDFGDLPDPTYPTLLASDGARHVIDPASSVFLGNAVSGCVDVENDGAPSVAATGDDLTATLHTSADAGICDDADDEDGVSIPGDMLVACQIAQISVTARGAGRLDAWIDFDPTSSPGFDAADQIATNVALPSGTTVLPVAVPCSAEVDVTSYARFRFSSAGGLAVDGLAMDGEVEDYTVFIKGSDFGDAPDSYDTTTSSGGAKHGVDPRSGNEFVLGSCADTEIDGPGGGTAIEDDGGLATSTGGVCSVANDDEDGVTFAGGMAMAGACTSGNSFEVQLLNNAAVSTPRLDAWIDWNGDGDFDHPAEHLFGGTSATLVGGVNALSYSVPCDAFPQLISYSRFRLSSTGGLLPAGDSLDGEVEDYAFQVKGIDFGDAPDSYGTTLGSALGDASHTIIPGYSLGATEDTESDGQPSPGATGDGSDEDGVVFAGGMAMAGACSTNNPVTVTLTDTAGVGSALLDGWIDWNGDGDFDHPAEHLFGGTSVALAPGANALSYDAPCSSVPQAVSFSRFRLSSTGGLGPVDGPGVGPRSDGEVEDYAFQVKGVDFGDAPDSYGTTSGSALGDASHTIVPGFLLGSTEDTEADGQPSADASGDGSDEDGVVFEGGMAMAGACTTGNGVDVTLTNSAGVSPALLDAWIDFDGNGVFDHPAEHLFGGGSAALVGGVNSLTYDVPCEASPQTVGFARFRLSSTGGLSPADGVGVDPVIDGEVEDYVLQVKGVDFGDAPDTYGTLEASSGPRHTIVPGFHLGVSEDSEPDGQPNDNADGDGADEDGIVLIGGQGNACTTGHEIEVTLTDTAGIGTAFLDAWIDFDGNGLFDHPVEHLFGATSAALVGGTNTVTYDVPCDATPREVSYGRFRLSSTGGLLPTDAGEPVADGEVEDYAFRLKGVDFGDAPDSYGTLDASGGPSHTIVPGYSLGVSEDSESDGQPSPDADGDGADEDGVVFGGGMAMAYACSTGNAIEVTLENSAGLLSAFLDGWIDFDGNGSFDDPAEHLFGGSSVALVAGVNDLTYDVPCTALRQEVSYARFRLSSSGGLLPTDTPGNPVIDGEIEDYTFEVKGVDLGDAPDSYATTFGAGGAFHPVDPEPGSQLYLGSCVDTESDGQPSGSANDDDLAIGTSVVGSCADDDDEDGVIFETRVVACQTADVTVTSSASGVLVGFLDFDGDGSFDLPRDQIFSDQPVTAGSNALSFPVPCDAPEVSTYVRFRLSSETGLSFDGGAMDGEVEDYVVVLDDSDFGDAPDSYGTLLASDGPLHGLDPVENLYLGTCVDAESEGQPGVGADGDDIDILGLPLATLGSCDPVDGDEDGVIFETMVIACQTAELTVTASIFASTAVLDAWVDLDGDGTFKGPADQIFANRALVSGANSLSFDVPCDASPGASYARFRVSTTGGLSSTGPSLDGEVEDHPIVVKGADFGDAPDSYSTTFGTNGPSHGVDPTPGAELFLGACVDTESDGQPSLDADGDDVGSGTSTAGSCDRGDDEDGVVFETDLNLCLDAEITVSASADGVLNAWIDFDGDGSFVGPNDQIFVDQPLSAGANALMFSVPCDSVPGESYTRFRFSTTSGLPFDGLAVDGEVEDHPVLIRGFDFGDAPDPLYPTLFGSDGARHIVRAVDNPTLGVLTDIETEGQQSPDHLGDDLDGVDDEDGVTFTSPLYIPNAPASIEVQTGATGGILNAWIDYNRNGSWTDPGEQIATGLAIGPNSVEVLDFVFADEPLADVGTSCARFRFSSAGDPLPTGQSLDGEVEDYELEITAENPQIGLAKELIDVQRVGGATYELTFLMRVENLGNIRVNDIQIEAEFAVAFMDAVSYSVTMAPDSTDLTINPAFDGDADFEVLSGTDSLAPGDSGEVLVFVNVVPGGNVGPYVCSAGLTGVSDADTPVSDVSQDGTEPDPDGDGDPVEDDPTLVIFDLPPVEIPAADTLGLVILAVLLLLSSVRTIRRTQR